MRTPIPAQSPLSNTEKSTLSHIAGEIADYEAAVAWAMSPHMSRGRKVAGLHRGPILFCAESLRQLGSFDNELAVSGYVIRDYCLRMILNHWDIKICEGALVWNMPGSEHSPAADSADRKKLEQKWGMHYFNTSYSANLISMIHKNREDEITVLEVGCDCGATLLEIQNRYPNARIYGCEINDKAARIASLFATVRVGNIEEQNLGYPPGMFDYIIFGDVLEHLRDPLKVIQYCRTLLKRGGFVIASIPNLMHISVIADLLDGNFTYTEMGLLDKTHIHLFTFNEIVRMFQSGGYTITDLSTAVPPLSEEHSLLIDQLLKYSHHAKRHMYETFQYVVAATPVPD